MSDNQNNQAAKFSDLIASLNYKVSIRDESLTLSKSETERVLSLLVKTRDYLTGLEIEVEKLRETKERK